MGQCNSLVLVWLATSKAGLPLEKLLTGCQITLES